MGLYAHMSNTEPLQLYLHDSMQQKNFGLKRHCSKLYYSRKKIPNFLEFE